MTKEQTTAEHIAEKRLTKVTALAGILFLGRVHPDTVLDMSRESWAIAAKGARCKPPNSRETVTMTAQLLRNMYRGSRMRCPHCKALIKACPWVGVKCKEPKKRAK